MQDLFPISGLNHREIEAWATLFDQYYTALCSYANRFLNDTENTKDLVQDLFLNIWKSGKTFKDQRELTNYLYRSCYNNALIFIRNRNLRSSILDKLSVPDIDDPDEVYALTLREEVLRQLHHHIESLPAEQRKVILLTIEGYSGSEIAEKLAVSINTVKTHRNRGLKFLRSRMKNHIYLFLF